MYKLIIDNENCIKVKYAKSFMDRFIGLMGKRDFDGLLFKQKYQNRYLSSIHTHFMRVPIDVIYLNDKLEVTQLVTLKPWKYFIPKQNNTLYIIELPIMTIKKNNITLNSKIELIKI